MPIFSGNVRGRYLNLRQSCSRSSSRLASIPNGTALQIETVSGQDEWFRTTYNGQTGYVVAQYIAITNDGGLATVTLSSGVLNIRASASTSAVSLYTVGNGIQLRLIDQNTYTNWCRVSSSSGTGWANKAYLTIISGSGSSSSVSGVIGTGPNSRVSAADRANTGKCWMKDLSTTHPQIRTLQHMLQMFYDDKLQFSDYGSLTIDGIFGNDTDQFVRLFQHYSGHGLAEDGKVGYYTLTHLETDTGMHIT